MQGLIIDTSSNRSFILLADGETLLGALTLNGGEELSKKIAIQLNDFLNQNPSFHADYIAAGTGPGSYTGIRVGVALAKSLAFGWQIPILGFCGLQAFTPTMPGSFAILLDARMGGLYCLKGLRTEQDVHWDDPCLIPVDHPFEARCVLFSPHPADIKKRRPAETQAIHEVQPDFELLAKFCHKKAKESAHSPVDPLPLVYGAGPLSFQSSLSSPLEGKTPNILR